MSAHHPSRPFATVAVEGSFGVRRRQSLRLLGAVPHLNVLHRHAQHPRLRHPRIGPMRRPAREDFRR